MTISANCTTIEMPESYFEGEMLSVQYSFDSVVKVNIYDDLFIDFSEISKMLNS